MLLRGSEKHRRGDTHIVHEDAQSGEEARAGSFPVNPVSCAGVAARF